jgi:hypothetical protein
VPPKKPSKKKSRVGRPRKPDRGRMSLYLPVQLVEHLRAVADRRRMAYSALVEEYIADGLARDEKRFAEIAGT